VAVEAVAVEAVAAGAPLQTVVGSATLTDATAGVAFTTVD